MKKKLLSLLMVVMLVIPIVGVGSASKAKAADVTDKVGYVSWEVVNPGATIPDYSDEFWQWFFVEQNGWGNRLIPEGSTPGQETIGLKSVLKVNWEKSTISKERIIAIRPYLRTVVKKANGELDMEYGGEPPYGAISHPMCWGGNENYSPSEPMNHQYFTENGEDYSYFWEDDYLLADWVKQESFSGLDVGGYYSDLVDFFNNHGSFDEEDCILFIKVVYLDNNDKWYETEMAIPLEKKSGNYLASFKAPDNTNMVETEEVDLSEKESQAISKDDFDKLIEDNKKKDIVIKNKDGLTFTFPKGSLSAVEGKTEYDFGTTFVNEFAAGTLPSFVTASNFVKTISFGYSGKLPGKATIKIPLGAEYAGKTLYYSYVKESGLTEVQEVTADAEGNIEVTQDHCSDYVVTTENPDTQAVKSPATGDDSFTGVLFMMLLLSLVGAGIAMRVRTKCEQ
ncbi:MAG: hypothetical protein E7241_11560 [Lachnospiraceae bacterium]|nr:hypothetical protein [Lachnospiraceae bacterium]